MLCFYPGVEAQTSSSMLCSLAGTVPEHHPNVVFENSSSDGDFYTSLAKFPQNESYALSPGAETKLYLSTC